MLFACAFLKMTLNYHLKKLSYHFIMSLPTEICDVLIFNV